MKNISPELYCVIGVAAFICGVFLLAISLDSSGDVWILGMHLYQRNLNVIATLVAMIGGSATAYGLIHLRRPPNAD